MPRSRTRLSAQQIADQAFAQTQHTAIVPRGSPSPVRQPAADSTEAIARSTAQAVLSQSLDAIERMEPVLEAMTAVMVQSVEAKQVRNGRELTDFERDPEKVGRLVRLLARGNYRETACKLAGIAPSSLRNWMKAAEDGDPRFQAIAGAVTCAEACAEDESIGDVRRAAKDPRFWPAGMTWAERKFPDRWGRRTDDHDTPKVVVQIGGNVEDVKILAVQVSPAPVLPSSGKSDA